MNIIHWLFGDRSLIAKLFGYYRKDEPKVPDPPKPEPVPEPEPIPEPEPEPKPEPLPPIPSREQVCGVQLTFQGLMVDTQEFGSLPWFDGTIASFNPEDRKRIYEAKKAKGDKHCILTISWNYNEPGQPYGSANRVPGKDLWNDLPTYRSLVEEIIRAGFVPLLMLAGDGRSVRGLNQYNDPVGWTYGYENICAKLPEIVKVLKGDDQSPDLTPYCLFCPGFDGVFYGWDNLPGEGEDKMPERVANFGKVFRGLLPNGHLAIEHNTGHIPCGEGGGDFQRGGRMSTYDVILSEFGVPLRSDSLWQIAGRLLGPEYRRPADQPADDDPRPPFYLAPGTERGPYFTCAFEMVDPGLYSWVRGRCSSEAIEKDRAYLRQIGYRYTG